MISWSKRSLILAVCCACFASARGFAASPGPDARALGVAEAMRDYCAKAYPASAAMHEMRVRRLIEGLSPVALARVRRSEPYRRAHAAEADFVGKIDPHNAKRACFRLPVNPKKPRMP